MIKFSYYLQVFLQVIFAQIIFGSDIFQLRYNDLQSLLVNSRSNRNFQTVEDVLARDGAFAVSGLPPDYTQSVIELQSSAPSCLDSAPGDQAVFSLPDGSRRWTWARDSSGSSDQFPSCLSGPASVIEGHYNTLDSLVSRVITRIAGEEDTEWRDLDTSARGNFSTQLYKEHVHVYTSGNTQSQDESSFAAPFHVDSGLLLFLTPFKKHPLLIKNRFQDNVNTNNLKEGSVIVILASALPNWLLKGKDSSKKFFAAPHAVPSLSSNLLSRTVFARMKIAPDTAIPLSSGHHGLQFGDYFSGKASSKPVEEAASLCPLPGLVPELPVASPLQQDWADLKKTECDSGKAFCWMNCLDLPKDQCSDTDLVCRNGVSKQCCTDTVTQDCANMDPSCAWECGAGETNKSTESHVTMEDMEDTEGDNFCNGAGTDMFMQGFQSSGNAKDVCVILLFNSWILDTRTKFAIASIGVILLGIGIEAMLCFRRKLQKRRILPRINGLYRRVAIVALFGLNIASGYFAMLVAMTYSVELFICMIIGLVMGHAIFNTGAAVGESVDPCCASQRDHVLVRVEEDFGDCDQSDLGSVTREEAGNGHCCHDEPDTSVLSD